MQTSTTDSPKPYTRQIFTVTSIGHALCHINMLVFAAILLPLSQEFSLTLTEITGVGSLSLLLFGLGSLPAGILTRLKNPKFMLLIYFAGGAGSSILIWLSSSLLQFSIGLALLGAFSSIYHSAALTLMSHTITKIGKTLGIHGVAGSAGITLAPLAAGVLASAFGWRSVYLVLAVISLFGFVFLLMSTSIPKEATVKRKTPSASRNSMILFFLVFIVIMLLNGVVYRAFLTMFPTYLSQKIRLGNVPPLLTGGFLASAILATGMIGQYIGGLLSDRFNKLGLYAAILALASVFLILIGVSGGVFVVIASALFSLVFFPNQPVENSIISVITPEKYTSSFYGIRFVLSFGVGGLGAVLAGFISDNLGLNAVFWISGIIAGAAAAAAYILYVIGRKQGMDVS